MSPIVHDALVACIARWLPVLEEAELRAVEADVLRRVIAAREAKIAAEKPHDWPGPFELGGES